MPLHMKRTLTRVLFAIALVIGMEYQGSDAHADEPAEQKSLPQPTQSIFETYTFAGSQSAFTTKATAFTGLPIDTDVLERLIKTRLRDVEQRALRDIFAASVGPDGSLPVLDLVRTLGALAVASADADSRSQTILAALVRDGLAFTVVALTQGSGSDARPVFCNDACRGDRELLDAAYLGLARSTYLHALSFPEKESRKEPLSTECATYSRHVSTMVDALSAKLVNRKLPAALVQIKGSAQDALKYCTAAGDDLSYSVGCRSSPAA
jgi:hypothetical protein